MSHSRDWMPQFNWPVFGPLLGIIATVLLVGAVVGSRLAGGGPSDPTAFGTNPDRDAALPDSPGRGGAGPVLVAPGAQELKLRSISARVNGLPTVRRGPGTQYAGIHQLRHGEEVHVIACAPGCEWMRILSLTEPDSQLWLPSVFLTLNSKADALPVLTPP